MVHILRELNTKGLRARSVSIAHLPELEEELEERRINGDLQEGFFRERLADFQFEPPESLPKASTIIIIAFPQPIIQVSFHRNGDRSPLIIPPTYQFYPNTVTERLLKKVLSQTGHRLARTILPLKLLAVRSGLGSYGRNNICYVPGMGSYHRLMAFFTDFPLTEDSWQSAKLMESCSRCSACLYSCPTGAITPNRFLIRAHRCLTYLNERPSEFPAWVNPSWHNALVGCMRCQEVCPANASFKKIIEPLDYFSKEESRILLNEVNPAKLSLSMRKRLKKLGLWEYVDLLPRNIRLVMDELKK